MSNKFGLDLDGAWRRLLREARGQEVPDVLGWEDHKLRWERWKADIEESLNNGTYQPHAPLIVERPKDNFAVRPMALLHPIDRVVYEAVVDSMTRQIDKVLPKEVRSSRLRDPDKLETERQVRAWLTFQERGRDLYKTQSFEYLLSTDVVSYFEYIDIGILASDLKSLPEVKHDVVDLLSLILNGFQRSSHVWGLPQGIRASSILGNLYMLPLDRALEREPDVEYLRYQDDIKVFSDASYKLRRALQRMNRALRGRHLNLSVHKTKMVEGPAILDEFEDLRKDAIQYGLRISTPGVKDDLRRLFDDAVAQSPPATRDIRFAIYRLAQLEDPHAVPWILEHLSEIPYLAEQLVDYLSVLVPTNAAIEERVRSYLSNENENLYPWVEMQLLRMLARAPKISDETYTCGWKILEDERKENLARQYAARCLGRHIRPGDVASLKDAFTAQGDFWLRRALLVAIADAEAQAGAVDKAWFGTVAATDTELEATAKFLRSATTLPEP